MFFLSLCTWKSHPCFALGHTYTLTSTYVHSTLDCGHAVTCKYSFNCFPKWTLHWLIARTHPVIIIYAACFIMYLKLSPLCFFFSSKNSFTYTSTHKIFKKKLQIHKSHCHFIWDCWKSVLSVYICNIVLILTLAPHVIICKIQLCSCTRLCMLPHLILCRQPSRVMSSLENIYHLPGKKIVMYNIIVYSHFCQIQFRKSLDILV